MTMKDSFLRLNKLGEKDSQALREEYKEWLEAGERGKNNNMLCISI